MDIDLDALQKAAEAVVEDNCWPFACNVFRKQANPDVVLELVRQLKAARALLSEVLDMNEDNALVNFAGRPSSRFDKVADRIQTLLDGGAQ